MTHLATDILNLPIKCLYLVIELNYLGLKYIFQEFLRYPGIQTSQSKVDLEFFITTQYAIDLSFLCSCSFLLSRFVKCCILPSFFIILIIGKCDETHDHKCLPRRRQTRKCALYNISIFLLFWCFFSNLKILCRLSQLP